MTQIPFRDFSEMIAHECEDACPSDGRKEVQWNEQSCRHLGDAKSDRPGHTEAVDEAKADAEGERMPINEGQSLGEGPFSCDAPNRVAIPAPTPEAEAQLVDKEAAHAGCKCCGVGAKEGMSRSDPTENDRSFAFHGSAKAHADGTKFMNQSDK